MMLRKTQTQLAGLRTSESTCLEDSSAASASADIRQRGPASGQRTQAASRSKAPLQHDHAPSTTTIKLPSQVRASKSSISPWTDVSPGTALCEERLLRAHRSTQEPPSRVSVVVRLREDAEAPGTSQRVTSAHPNVFVPTPDGVQVIGPFARILPFDSTQAAVYRGVVSPLLPLLLAGFSTSVLTYGFTGSGKTHSLSGPPALRPDVHPHLKAPASVTAGSGMVARFASELVLSLKESMASNPSFRVKLKLHFFEVAPKGAAGGAVGAKAESSSVYNLLANYSCSNTSHPLARTASGTPEPTAIPSMRLAYCHESASCAYVGVTPVTISLDSENPFQDVMAAYYHACRRRHTRCTSLNETSSRSHTLFIITLEQMDQRQPEYELISKMTFVDLAGAEHAGVQGDCPGHQSVREGGWIRTSLTKLQDAVGQLATGQKVDASSIRASPLLKLLAESLTGRSCLVVMMHAKQDVPEMREHLRMYQQGFEFAVKCGLLTVQARCGEVGSVDIVRAQQEVIKYERTVSHLQRQLALEAVQSQVASLKLSELEGLLRVANTRLNAVTMELDDLKGEKALSYGDASALTEYIIREHATPLTELLRQHLLSAPAQRGSTAHMDVSRLLPSVRVIELQLRLSRRDLMNSIEYLDVLCTPDSSERRELHQAASIHGEGSGTRAAGLTLSDGIRASYVQVSLALLHWNVLVGAQATCDELIKQLRDAIEPLLAQEACCELRDDVRQIFAASTQDSPANSIQTRVRDVLKADLKIDSDDERDVDVRLQLEKLRDALLLTFPALKDQPVGSIAPSADIDLEAWPRTMAQASGESRSKRAPRGWLSFLLGIGVTVAFVALERRVFA